MDRETIRDLEIEIDELERKLEEMWRHIMELGYAYPSEWDKWFNESGRFK